MYSVSLHESHFPAQADHRVSETTVGGVLRAQAGKTPGAEALVEADIAERWGEIVAGFVRLATGSSLDRAALVAHCRDRISPQKTPAHWIAVQDWPLTGSGKIQKFVLRDRFVAGEFEAV